MKKKQKKTKATQLEFLRWFYKEACASQLATDLMIEQFTRETGLELPNGY